MARYMRGHKIDSVLIVRPDHELVTKYLCVWSQELVDFAKQKGINTLDLKGKKATRKEFDSYVRAHTPSFIFVNGHGNSSVIAGYDDKLIIDKTSAVAPAIIYARSCDAGRELGPMLIRQGARAFIGYRRY